MNFLNFSSYLCVTATSFACFAACCAAATGKCVILFMSSRSLGSIGKNDCNDFLHSF